MFLNKRGRACASVGACTPDPFRRSNSGNFSLPARDPGGGSARKGGRAAPFSLSNCLHGRIIVYTKEAEHRERKRKSGRANAFRFGFQTMRKGRRKVFRHSHRAHPLPLRNASPPLLPATLNRNEL